VGTGRFGIFGKCGKKVLLVPFPKNLKTPKAPSSDCAYLLLAKIKKRPNFLMRFETNVCNFSCFCLPSSKKSDRMRKTSTRINIPSLQPPTITKTLTRFHNDDKKEVNDPTPVQPNEETVDRLNDIGKTYPFCVYYRQRKNDPL
jgi:hypothetical protein